MSDQDMIEALGVIGHHAVLIHLAISQIAELSGKDPDRVREELFRKALLCFEGMTPEQLQVAADRNLTTLAKVRNEYLSGDLPTLRG